RLLDDRLGALAADRDQVRRGTLAVALQGVVPEDLPGLRVEAVDVPIRRDDQAVAVKQDRHVARVHLRVRPDDLTRLPVQCQRVTVKPDEDQLLDGHGRNHPGPGWGPRLEMSRCGSASDVFAREGRLLGLAALDPRYC